MTYNENNEPCIDIRKMLEIVEIQFKADIMNAAYGFLSEAELGLTNTECAVLAMEICDKIPDETYKPEFPINEEHFEAFVIKHGEQYVKGRNKL